MSTKVINITTTEGTFHVVRTQTPEGTYFMACVLLSMVTPNQPMTHGSTLGIVNPKPRTYGEVGSELAPAHIACLPVTDPVRAAWHESRLQLAQRLITTVWPEAAFGVRRGYGLFLASR